jgi:hypothetical protein
MSYAIHTPTKREHDAVIKYLTENEYKGRDLSNHAHVYKSDHCIQPSGSNVFYSPKEFFLSENSEVISTTTFFAIKGIDFEPETTIQLNESYCAVIDHQAKQIKVGCQTFQFSSIEKLHKAINE